MLHSDTVEVFRINQNPSDPSQILTEIGMEFTGAVTPQGHEPGVVSETTVDGNGPFERLGNDYFFEEFGPPQDEGSRQNISSRNTRHLRSFWDSVRRWLHHDDAHGVREILLAPDSEVPITFGDSRGGLTGDGRGPIYISLDSPFVTNPDGSLQIDRLGTSNLAPLIVNGQINPALAANHIRVIKDTHGATSRLSAADIDALSKYLLSLE